MHLDLKAHHHLDLHLNWFLNPHLNLQLNLQFVPNSEVQGTELFQSLKSTIISTFEIIELRIVSLFLVF